MYGLYVFIIRRVVDLTFQNNFFKPNTRTVDPGLAVAHAAARRTRTRASSAPQCLTHWPWNLPQWMNTSRRTCRPLVGRFWSVTEALLNRFWSASEAQNYRIELVGNIDPGRLKWPFCKIRPLLVGFKTQTRAPKTRKLLPRLLSPRLGLKTH